MPLWPREGCSDRCLWTGWVLTLREAGHGKKIAHWEAQTLPPREYVEAAKLMSVCLWRMAGNFVPVLDWLLMPEGIRPVSK